MEQAGTPERVAVTDAAASQLRRLRRRNGPLMFHQSGGCCDGSSPMCFPDGDFITSEADVRLGDLAVAAEGDDEAFTVPVWMSKEQFQLWSHTHLTIDLVKGRGAGFSLEAPDGVRFLIRSRLITAAGVPDELSGPVSCEVPAAGGTGR
ncbi:DUF779 domain-containing protein [Kineococcus rubinsiae]|uniref:DUF779 domain-containing protein n=1 Tax=Kineococcus rubinsiae TaxID=2609562 RepID=UPI0027E4E70A|nr:DUF779 domain-containing protein [Kineococcus rubinsiae]